MGKNDFAGMPPKCFTKEFGSEPQFRRGIANSFVSNIQNVSHIEENGS